MPLSENINNLEKDKFVLDAEGNTAVRVIPDGGWVSGAIGRKIIATYPNSVTEVYTYKLNAATLFVLTVVYTTSSKEFIDYVERTA
jgi:hypothetical protein